SPMSGARCIARESHGEKLKVVAAKSEALVQRFRGAVAAPHLEMDSPDAPSLTFGEQRRQGCATKPLAPKPRPHEQIVHERVQAAILHAEAASWYRGDVFTIV